MEIRIDDGGAADGPPAILIDARMSLWTAYDGTKFADADAARMYFDTEFNGMPEEAATP